MKTVIVPKTAAITLSLGMLFQGIYKLIQKDSSGVSEIIMSISTVAAAYSGPGK